MCKQVCKLNFKHLIVVVVSSCFFPFLLSWKKFSSVANFWFSGWEECSGIAQRVLVLEHDDQCPGAQGSSPWAWWTMPFWLIYVIFSLCGLQLVKVLLNVDRRVYYALALLGFLFVLYVGIQTSPVIVFVFTVCSCSMLFACYLASWVLAKDEGPPEMSEVLHLTLIHPSIFHACDNHEYSSGNQWFLFFQFDVRSMHLKKRSLCTKVRKWNLRSHCRTRNVTL